MDPHAPDDSACGVKETYKRYSLGLDRQLVGRAMAAKRNPKLVSDGLEPPCRSIGDNPDGACLALVCLKCYTRLMRPRTAAEEHLDRQLSDPSYAAAYQRAARRIAMFDDVVRSLEARRQELGMTKAELARRADMPPAVIRRLFSQQHKNPTLTSLAAIADALELTICVAPGGSLPRLSISTENGAHSPEASISAPSRAYGTRRRTA